MSYDVGMSYPPCTHCGQDRPVLVDRHMDGGTYVIGGTDRAELNITYNYSSHFRDALNKEQGLRWLYGKKGADVQSALADAVAILGTARDPNYWAATPGNAGHALSILLRWARQHPEAVFYGD